MAQIDDLPSDQTGLAQRTARGGVLTVASQGGRFIIRILSQIILARLLLPQDYGLVAMVAPVIALVGLLGDLGLAQATMIQRSVTHQQVTALFWIGFFVSCSLALLVIASTPLLVLAFDEPRLGPIALCMAAVMPISSFGTQHLALVVRKMRFPILSLGDVGAPIVGLCAGVTAALSGLGYWSIVIASAAEAIFNTTMLVIASGWWPGRPRFERATWSMLKIGGQLTAFGITNYITGSADKMLLGLAHGSVPLGLYDKGYKTVSQPVSQLVAPFSRVAVPLLTRLRDDPQRYTGAFRRLIEMMLLAAVPGLLTLIVYSPPIVLTVFGPNWTEIAPVVSWLCVGALGSIVGASMSWVFVSQQRTGEQLRYAVITMVISVAGFLVGLYWGAVGVAASSGLTFLLVCVPITCRGATRAGPLSGQALLAALWPFVVAALCAAGILFAAYRMFDGGHADLLRIAPAGALSYGAFLLVLSLFPSGRRAVREAWDSRRLVLPQSWSWRGLRRGKQAA